MFLEYHFHVYFNSDDVDQVEIAKGIRKALVENLEDVNSFVAIPLHHFIGETRILNEMELNVGHSHDIESRTSDTHGLNMHSIGPHPVGSFETWVPVEHFATAYAWFVNHRGPLSVLIHPLTKFEIRDHTRGAAWMGSPISLDISQLSHELPVLESQYPQFRLGYAAAVRLMKTDTSCYYRSSSSSGSPPRGKVSTASSSLSSSSSSSSSRAFGPLHLDSHDHVKLRPRPKLTRTNISFQGAGTQENDENCDDNDNCTMYGNCGRDCRYRRCFVCARIGIKRYDTAYYCTHCRVAVCRDVIRYDKQNEPYSCWNELHKNPTFELHVDKTRQKQLKKVKKVMKTM